MPVNINDPLYLCHDMFNYMIKQIYNAYKSHTLYIKKKYRFSLFFVFVFVVWCLTPLEKNDKTETNRKPI
jgi:hypothetical protein